MKIGFLITSTGWGGLEMNTLKLAGKLQEIGYEITLITTAESTLLAKGKSGFADVMLLKNHKKYLDIRNAYIIAKKLKLQGIGTVLVFDNRDIDVISFAKKLFYQRLRIIYQQHMQIGISKKDFIHTFKYKSINYWITPLEKLKQEVLNRTNYPEERIRVIPIGLDEKRFLSRKYSKEEALLKLNITSKAPLIGVIGRISRKKGQDLLVRALPELKKRGIEAELLVFGSPTVNDADCSKYRDELNQLVTDNDLQQKVHFIGYSEETELFYNAIDIFALPSQSETYGMVTIEAILSAIPVIATDAGGTPEILGNGTFGLLYEFNDLFSFCEKVKWLLNNPVEVKEMTLKAQKEASGKYSHVKEAEQINLLIKDKA